MRRGQLWVLGVLTLGILLAAAGLILGLLATPPAVALVAVSAVGIVLVLPLYVALVASARRARR